MSLQQAITEIEARLVALSFIKYKDPRDKSLADSGAGLDKHFLVMPDVDPKPWIDAEVNASAWSIGLRIELATLESSDVSTARITASERARQVIEDLQYTPLVYGQLYQVTTETIESDNQFIWVYRAQLRYQE